MLNIVHGFQRRGQRGPRRYAIGALRKRPLRRRLSLLPKSLAAVLAKTPRPPLPAFTARGLSRPARRELEIAAGQAIGGHGAILSQDKRAPGREFI